MHGWELLGTLKWGVICRSMAHSFSSGVKRYAEGAAIGGRASQAEINLLQLRAPCSRKAA